MSLGLITIFTLPTSPEKTKWLNEEERALAVRRLEIEHLGTTHEPTTPRLVLKACLNWRTWLAVAGYSFINVIVQGTSIFLPTIINGLGKYSATQVQLRTVPPYIVASAVRFVSLALLPLANTDALRPLAVGLRHLVLRLEDPCARLLRRWFDRPLHRRLHHVPGVEGPKGSLRRFLPHFHRRSCVLASPPS